MSSRADSGHNPITSDQRAGLRFSMYAPREGATHSPPTKFENFSAISLCSFWALRPKSKLAGCAAPTNVSSRTLQHDLPATHADVAHEWRELERDRVCRQIVVGLAGELIDELALHPLWKHQ